MAFSITTAMATSFKQEILEAGHCFMATTTGITGNTTSANNSIGSLTVASMGYIAVGMTVSGTGVSAGTVVTAITGSNSITVYPAPTSTSVGNALTFTADTFKMALLSSAAAGTYSASNTNYSNIGADEVGNSSGYTSTGQALTNSGCSTSGTGAYTNFNNPSWTSATFSTVGAMIYNTSDRVGGVSGTNSSGAGRCCGVYSFNGTQTVTSGTFTVTMPAAAPSTAILAIQ